MRKKTAGKAALELQEKKDEKINPIDLQREIHKGNMGDDSWENQLKIAVERGKKELNKNDFFIVVLFKKERLFLNIVRQYFFPRLTCPTPEYDQCVYHYVDGDLKFVWTVPDKETCKRLMSLKECLSKEFQELNDFVIKFYNGELDQWAKNLNKEKLS